MTEPITTEAPAPRVKRVRDAVATEKRILDTAEEMFARRGLDAVTTKEIAAGAGVAVGALYHHFASKDAIYAAVVERAFGGSSVIPPETRDPARSARDRLELLLTWYLQALVDNEIFRGLLNREVLTPRSNMPQLLDRGLFAEPLSLFSEILREIDPDLDAELAMASTFALLFGLTNLRSLSGSYPAVQRLATAEQIAAHTVRLVLDGLT
ncbi:TetR/AcrR family transcriptional regulator [Sporichthya polymorpha]|uniref:TetR/AcrR family transcriptional regulator n=1 Tax=Sporichthya polymorpha TaxID=35751 RepID=UPI000366DAFE|nr:TetR/AcrR family transcriptional regulator [Sporichthya polymorpha]